VCVCVCVCARIPKFANKNYKVKNPIIRSQLCNCNYFCCLAAAKLSEEEGD